jgi:tetratricopeptide (TPR) repeat protein
LKRDPIVISAEDASLIAQAYLAKPLSERNVDQRQEALSSPDVLAAICKTLWDVLNLAPAKVAEESIAVHEWLRGDGAFEGLFDERQYFQGEAALLAAAALRILGEREETESWLARAEASYRHTVNPAPRSASVAYVRLALLYDRGRYEDVIDLSPSLVSSFERLGMKKEEGKTRLLKAAALKVTGHTSQAVEELLPILDNPEIRADAQLSARVLIDIGDSHQIQGDAAGALNVFQQASRLLEQEPATGTLADLKMDIGALLRSLNRFGDAAQAFREAATIFASLKMSTRAAYLRLLLAETLVAASRPREAEWEILAALPTIEEQKMVPEGFAAVALLKESVRRRKTDPNALRELREHLQKQN